jgi:hypothetical protein
LFDEQSKRSSILDGVIGEVDALTMFECMDDNVEVPSSSGGIVRSRYIEGSSLHVILDLNGFLLATSFKIIWKMGHVTNTWKTFDSFLNCHFEA